MSDAPVPVPPDVAEAHAAPAWLRAHRDEYARGIFHGFRASEPALPDTNHED